ncbi:MAG: cysteine--tRNA ligase [Acidimicrobiales bacterium]
MLRLFDSAVLSSVEVIEPGATSLTLYNCGPTVYDDPHIGHGRAILTFDLLRRYLEYRGVSVTHVSNITDIDDKIIERASDRKVLPSEIAEEYETRWWAAVDALGAKRPNHAPRATEWIPQMRDLVLRLVDSGAAYAGDDGVYLEVHKVADYGLLARQDLGDLRAGARVATQAFKRSPLDFALWKFSETEPSYEFSLGNGRPGWHTECVVMSLGLLGEGFDLHGGGLDLRFPHHENERAQAVALGATFAKHWIHHGFVEVSGEKMSKSLGNFTTLTDLLAHVDPRAYRLLVARAHYRSPLEVGPGLLDEATATLGRIDRFMQRVVDVERAFGGEYDPEYYDSAAGNFVLAMDDDLDSPRAMAGLFDAISRANADFDAGAIPQALGAGRAIRDIVDALGLVKQEEVEIPAAITELADRRVAAKSARDFALADRIREEIMERGYLIDDIPDGFRLRRK